jgi:hypothetical protein
MIIKSFNAAVALAILAAILFFAPQSASARDRRSPDRKAKSSKFDREELLRLFKKKQAKRGREVIAAPNGNTGINGSGLPKPKKKGKKRPGRVIPAPNGNTGINGTGLPQ